ncbi:cupin domain-containing protein [Telmatospirillum sp.]|uniref:cupin domain-containing protein n=1 Tax=Telmatospirillum sp. TaxID=2079197 RepID=UPI0028449BA8|nr:cupin domain-containing protein [Telmatospirillum sp.]MDR3440740.1 cupin domain-containing protein [Telmatospirillum sp.]
MKTAIAVTGLFVQNAPQSSGSIPFDQIEFTPYKVEGRKGVSVHTLYDTRNTDPLGPAAAIVRYEAGAVTPRHLHPGYELVFVLRGELIDDRGTHTSGSLQIYPPDSHHELRSEIGCEFLVVWEQPVRSLPT